MRRPIKGLLSLVCWMVLLAPSAFGQECEPSRRGSSRYCFALDVIQTLRLAHDTYTLYGDSGRLGLAPCFTAGATDVIYRAKQRQQAFDQAFGVLRRYAASGDSSIRLSRQALILAYVTHWNAARDVQRYCRHFADGTLPAGLETPSQIADSAAHGRLLMNNASKMVLVAVSEVSSGLADIDPATRRLGILRLSAEQREMLLTTMANAFGLGVTTFDSKNPTTLSTDFATAAAVFYDFLANPAWRLQPTRR